MKSSILIGCILVVLTNGLSDYKFPIYGSVPLTPYGENLQSRLIPIPRNFFGFGEIFRRKNADTQSLSAAIARIAALEASDVTSNARITALEADVTRCPTAAVGARRIDDFCYTVTTTLTEYRAASRACLSMGGYLAEPILTAAGLLAFATDINTVFSPGVTTAFIGLQEIVADDDIFWYPHSGASITRDDATALFTAPITANPLNFEAAVLAIPGGTLTLARQVLITTPDFAPTAAFICQYDLV